MARTGKQDRISPGRRFGRLTVEADTGQRKNRYAVRRCDCGCTTHIKGQ